MERPRRAAGTAPRYEVSKDEDQDFMDQSESEAEFMPDSGEEDGDDEQYESEAERSPKVFQI